MYYEVIREIRNSCANNQMRDVFFDEIETDDPDSFIAQSEPAATSIEKEILSGGLRYHVTAHNIPIVYTLTEC